MDEVIELIKAIPSAIQGVVSYFSKPDQRIFWLYLISSFMIAALLFVSASKKMGESSSIRNFVRYCFPREIWKHPSSRLDLRFFVVGQTIHILLFTWLSGLLLLIYGWSWNASLDLFGSVEWIRMGQQPSLLGILLMALLTALITDFVLYCMHNLQHRWSFLWEFHKVHHSATVMHPLTNYREHIFDNLLYVPVVTFTSGFVGGFLQCWYPGNEKLQFYILGVPLVSFIYNFFGYNLRHSHIWLAWPPVLGRIFGSPANHQIHHSAESRHMNKNFGFIFATWDWLFGTLYLPPKEKEEFSFGLADGNNDEYSSIARLYGLPFVRLYEKYAPKRLVRGS